MSPGSPWDELGIGPTGDVSMIRRAYAARLRAMDPDKDPASFIALREARDEALAAAADGTNAAFLNHLTVRSSDVDVAPTGGSENQIYPADPTGRDFGVHLSSLAETLLTEPPRDVPLSPEEEAAALHHLRKILSDPRLEEISFYSDTEDSIAEILASSVPRSDPLLFPAAQKFNWTEAADHGRQPPAIAFLATRAAELRFLQEVQSPGHEHHSAWRELTRSSDHGRGKGWRISRRRVSKLIHLVRSRYPGLEDELNPDRVDLWERSSRRAPTLWLLAIAALAAVRLLVVPATEGGQPTRVPTSDFPSHAVEYGSLTGPTADIDLVLDWIFGDHLSVAAVEAENPELHQLLVGHWTYFNRVGRARGQFAASTRDLLFQRYRAAIARASYPLVSDQARLMLDAAEAARQRGDWAACAGLLAGDPPATAPEEFGRRERALIARTLIEVQGPLPPPPDLRVLHIPDKVREDVARRTGLDLAAVSAAMRNEGPAHTRCEARLALIRSALAMPESEGLELLRKL